MSSYLEVKLTGYGSTYYGALGSGDCLTSVLLASLLLLYPCLSGLIKQKSSSGRYNRPILDLMLRIAKEAWEGKATGGISYSIVPAWLACLDAP